MSEIFFIENFALKKFIHFSFAEFIMVELKRMSS